MPAFVDTHRDIGLTTPVDKGELLLRRMSGTEGLGQVSEFHLDLVSENRALEATRYLGKPMTVSLRLDDHEKRHFHGFVTRFSATGVEGGLFGYRVTLHAWPWLLSRSVDCRIFQEKTVPQIIEQVFKDFGMSDYKLSLQNTYSPRTYCVQYRETHLDFVSRLMEEEGIYYFFQHEASRHVMVLTDSSSAHEPLTGAKKTLEFRPDAESGLSRNDTVFSWLTSREVSTAGYVLKAFDFERPRSDLTSRVSVTGSGGALLGEIFEYPSTDLESSARNDRARLRIQGLHANHEEVRSSTRFRPMTVGTWFAVSGHPNLSRNAEYLVTSASYELDAGDYGSGAEGAGDPFGCVFTVIPRTQDYRPVRRTPKPVIHGMQSAFVAGKEGEEMWFDKYGRVKVHFPWDRVGSNDENSSCWVRVAQMWAGKQWGTIFLPRIGQEVLVTFLEGDPDQPLITGSVYNADTMPPYTLPEGGTRSGVKTRSTKEGTSENFNEIRFEDKKDEEEIYVHAEKDMNRVVENNDTLKVGFDKKDKGDQTIEIFNNQTLTVGTSEAEKGDQKITIFHDRTLEVGHDHVVTVKNDETDDIKKNHKHTVGEDQTLDVKKNQKLTVGQDQTVNIGAKCVIEANSSIELKVGQSSIMIEPGKITLKSPQIAITADSQAEIKANATMAIEAGAKMDVKASGMLTIQGSLVKIN
ncbi:MAG: type VI secretion system tip protein TssI/VgrG [Burkholderiales bacterium]